jgi:hypothetical protein
VNATLLETGAVTGFGLTGDGLPTIYVSGENPSLRIVQDGRRYPSSLVGDRNPIWCLVAPSATKSATISPTTGANLKP